MRSLGTWTLVFVAGCTAWAQDSISSVSTVEDAVAFQNALMDRLAKEGGKSATVAKQLSREFARDLGCPSRKCDPLTKEMVIGYLERKVLPAIASDNSTKDLKSKLTVKSSPPDATVRWMLAGERDKANRG